MIENRRSYESIEEIPIDKNKVLMNRIYCELIQGSFNETKELLEKKTREICSEEHVEDALEKVLKLHEINFLNIFLTIWKIKTLEKVLELEKEERTFEAINLLIEKTIFSQEIRIHVEKFFLNEFWKSKAISSLFVSNSI